MGIADIIPGVSGGTIALITGIYERLVQAINGVNVFVVREILRRRFKFAFRNIKKVDFPFLLPLLAGIVVSFLSLSHLLSFLLASYASPTYAFFFGLILSSAATVYRRIGKGNLGCIPFLVFGLIFGFWLVGLTSIYVSHSLPIIFLSGSLAICAMILPGISGAFILLLLNQYRYMIDALHNLLFDRIFLFVAGALVGILSFARLLEILLNRWRKKTLSFLVGLMVGSLRAPLQNVISCKESMIVPLISGLMGVALIVLLELLSSKFFQSQDNVS